MKIGIDYRFAAKTVRGIGMYVRELVNQLMLIDTENEYILYTDSETNISLPSNFKIKQLKHSNIVLFEQVYLPMQARKDRLHLIWYPVNSGPLFLHPSVKLAVTVHDLIAMMNHNAVKNLSFQALKFRIGEYYRSFALRLGLTRVDLLLTVSQYSANQIWQTLNRKAEVVYNNVTLFEGTDDEGALLKFGLSKGKYYYSMTGELPHKNLKGLLELASNQPLPFKLVISGVHHASLISSLSEKYASSLVFTGYISEAEKICLYRYAAAFLFLPEYEGFGIPLLEAMQFNIPIIASNRASVPEVLGDAGELVDPSDLIRIRKLLENLPDTEIIKAKQARQIQRFSSWRRSTEKIHSLFIQTCSTQ